MSEYTIAVEGEPTTDKRLIRPGALTWATPMPVFGLQNPEDYTFAPILGTVESIERIEGPQRDLIVADITWFNEPPTEGGLCISVDSVEADFEDHTEVGVHGFEFRPMILKGGSIRAVFLGIPAWPDTDLGLQS